MGSKFRKEILMEKFVVGLILGIFLTLITVALYSDGQDRQACKAAGGVVISGDRGCYKIERIK